MGSRSRQVRRCKKVSVSMSRSINTAAASRTRIIDESLSVSSLAASLRLEILDMKQQLKTCNNQITILSAKTKLMSKWVKDTFNVEFPVRLLDQVSVVDFRTYISAPATLELELGSSLDTPTVSYNHPNGSRGKLEPSFAENEDSGLIGFNNMVSAPASLNTSNPVKLAENNLRRSKRIQISKLKDCRIIVSKQQEGPTPTVPKSQQRNKRMQNLKRKIDLLSNGDDIKPKIVKPRRIARITKLKRKPDQTRVVTLKTFYCAWPRCKSSLKGREEFLNHCRKHDPEKPFRCSWTTCKMQFREIDGLLNHLKLMHGGVDSFSCHVLNCGESFPKALMLKNHMKNPHNQERFICKWLNCGKSLSSKSGLYLHQRIHSPARKMFNCGFCDKSYLTKEGLGNHVRSLHTKETPYKCRICPLRFATNTNSRIDRHKCQKFKPK